MNWQYYYIISKDLVGRATDFDENSQLYIDGKWVDDKGHIIADRIIGYDGEEIGASDMLFDLEEITEDEAKKRMNEKVDFRKKALNISRKAHVDQLDKAGKPYIGHPLKVASAFEDDERYITALLHDVVEDSDITIEDLREEGFAESIILAIKVLTKTGSDYSEYIANIKKNPIARDVKIEDLKHNMDLNRLNKITNKDLKRVDKYKKSMEFLMNKFLY